MTSPRCDPVLPAGWPGAQRPVLPGRPGGRRQERGQVRELLDVTLASIDDGSAHISGPGSRGSGRRRGTGVRAQRGNPPWPGTDDLSL